MITSTIKPILAPNIFPGNVAPTVPAAAQRMVTEDGQAMTTEDGQVMLP